jgi:uncharacterized protein
MAQSNLELVQAAYAAFLRGDMDALPEYFDPDVVWHVPGRSAMAGTIEGRASVIAALTEVAALIAAGTVRLEVHDVLASDDHVVGLISEHAERDGQGFDDNFAQVIHIRDGRVTESWNLYTDPYARDEFWS